MHSSFSPRGFIRLSRGFTLIELLLVIGIIAILAAIVIVAINPTKQLGDARDAQRRSDVNTIMNAVYQYAIDNKGSIPACIVNETRSVCLNNDCTGVADGGCDLSVLVGEYIVGLPVDPSGATGNSTNYTIEQGANSRITVTAPNAENDAITVTR